MSQVNVEIIREIEQTLKNYFHAYLNADPQLLGKTFCTETRLLSVENDALEITDMRDWVKNVAERQLKKDIRQADPSILSIDVIGNIALAKVCLRFESFQFTDYLSLAKYGGVWKIVGKIYSKQTF